MANLCLVCGSEKSGKTHVIRQLIANATFNQLGDHRQCTWNIANKYYQTDVTLSIINNKNALKSSQEDEKSIEISQCSAIILLINLNQSQKAITIERDEWVDALSPYLSQSECNLLVGNYADSKVHPAHSVHSQSAWHQSLHGWSVDNGFEFVPSPHIPLQNDEEEKSDCLYSPHSPLFESVDAMECGHHRISSALQCVMWPNMQRKPLPKRNINTTVNSTIKNTVNQSKVETVQPLLSSSSLPENELDDDSERILFRKGDTVTVMGLQSKQHWNGRKGVIVGPLSRSKRRWPVEVEETEGVLQKALLRTKNLILDKKGPRWNTTNTVHNKETERITDNCDKELKNKEVIENLVWNNRHEEEEKGDEDLEQTMGSFESIMREMQRVREEAKSGTLTDEQRRQKAADAVMKLMPFMTGIEDDTASEAEKEAVEKTKCEAK